nr:hypothetical protein [Halogeometricum sp. CBA1124]
MERVRDARRIGEFREFPRRGRLGVDVEVALPQFDVVEAEVGEELDELGDRLGESKIERRPEPHYRPPVRADVSPSCIRPRGVGASSRFVSVRVRLRLVDCRSDRTHRVRER